MFIGVEVESSSDVEKEFRQNATSSQQPEKEGAMSAQAAAADPDALEHG
jgi:hypothetical protein